MVENSNDVKRGYLVLRLHKEWEEMAGAGINKVMVELPRGVIGMMPVFATAHYARDWGGRKYKVLEVGIANSKA